MNGHIHNSRSVLQINSGEFSPQWRLFQGVFDLVVVLEPAGFGAKPEQQIQNLQQTKGNKIKLSKN